MTSKYVNGQDNKHVILISIDGFRPAFYLDNSFIAPNLKRLRNEGVYSQGMSSVFPSYTYPSHAAMLTGALPSHTQIVSNRKMNSQEWFWKTDEIKCLTLWEKMKVYGLTSAAVQWPISVSPWITWNIPEIWDTLQPSDRISISRKFSTPGLVEEIEKYCTGTLDSNNMNEKYLTLDENVGAMSTYILKKYKPNFLAIHLTGLDAAQHEDGLISNGVFFALRKIDSIVGKIWSDIQELDFAEECTLLIVGDHGFSNMEMVLRPNKWITGLNCNFWATGGSAFLYGGADCDTSALMDSVRLRLSLIPSAYRKLFKVYDRRELDMQGADRNALAALGAKPGIVFSNSMVGEQLSKVRGGHHGYHPGLKEMKTGFIAVGNMISHGEIKHDINVSDIAALIAFALDIRMDFPHGVVPSGVFKNLKTIH